MQSIDWYKHRLKSMSPPEVLWRVRHRLSDFIDRRGHQRRRKHLRLPQVWSGSVDASTFQSAAVSNLPQSGKTPDWMKPEWQAALMTRAEALCNHHFSLFDIEDLNVGPRINWNFEYKTRRATPMDHVSRIDYRDHQVTGDCKWVWELNRHQHLVVLGRAYRITGDERFAREAAEQLECWIEQCPYGRGMNWRSPMELSIRLISWVWTLELIRPSEAVRKIDCKRLLETVWLHLHDVTRKYSRYSSANNHTIGEAAGVYIACSYFTGFRRSAAWRREARELLIQEIQTQTASDGGNREQALGYHLFVLQFFLLAGVCGRQTGDEFPPVYWDTLRRMLEFLGLLSEGGERLPMYGDCDDGYVFDLGGREDEARSLLAIGAALFADPRMKAWSREAREPVGWLLGATGAAGYERLSVESVEPEIRSHALRESGLYLLQCGERASPDRLSVTFDCGELGYRSIAAHGHADALSFTFRAFGEDVLVDPGTYDYFTYPQWRAYFRGTAAHNTVMIDGQEQSQMLGSFLWGERARCSCKLWQTSGSKAVVVGEHDGYMRLADPVSCRRTLTLDGDARMLTIEDEISGAGTHQLLLHLHFAEGCSVTARAGGMFDIQTASGELTLQIDEQLHGRLMRGVESPIGGWVSRGYHRRTPAFTLVAEGRMLDKVRFVHTVTARRTTETAPQRRLVSSTV